MEKYCRVFKKFYKEFTSLCFFGLYSIILLLTSSIFYHDLLQLKIDQQQTQMIVGGPNPKTGEIFMDANHQIYVQRISSFSISKSNESSSSKRGEENTRITDMDSGTSVTKSELELLIRDSKFTRDLESPSFIQRYNTFKKTHEREPHEVELRSWRWEDFEERQLLMMTMMNQTKKMASKINLSEWILFYYITTPETHVPLSVIRKWIKILKNDPTTITKNLDTKKTQSDTPKSTPNSKNTNDSSRLAESIQESGIMITRREIELFIRDSKFSRNLESPSFIERYDTFRHRHEREPREAELRSWRWEEFQRGQILWSRTTGHKINLSEWIFFYFITSPLGPVTSGGGGGVPPLKILREWIKIKNNFTQNLEHSESKLGAKRRRRRKREQEPSDGGQVTGEVDYDDDDDHNHDYDQDHDHGDYYDDQNLKKSSSLYKKTIFDASNHGGIDGTTVVHTINAAASLIQKIFSGFFKTDQDAWIFYCINAIGFSILNVLVVALELSAIYFLGSKSIESSGENACGHQSETAMMPRASSFSFLIDRGITWRERKRSCAHILFFLTLAFTFLFTSLCTLALLGSNILSIQINYPQLSRRHALAFLGTITVPGFIFSSATLGWLINFLFHGLSCAWGGGGRQQTALATSVASAAGVKQGGDRRGHELTKCRLNNGDKIEQNYAPDH